jgi:subtilisin family serine protease
VGAVTTTNTIASFSSRGVVTSDGSNRLKPDVSAPGVNVRSSFANSDTGYALLSGTSMAAPHTVGTVALVLSAHPQLIGNVGAAQTLLERSALHLAGAQTCGGIPGAQIPNTTFGWGRIDAFSALGPDDTDGDGLADWQEILAGTDANSAAGNLRITAIDRSGIDCRISFPSVLSKTYRLEAADDPVAPVWTTVADNVVGTGGVVQLADSNAFANAKRIYRVAVVP